MLLFPSFNRPFWAWMFSRSLNASGSRSSEPARWSFHQRKATAESYPTQNSGNGPSRHPTLCDLQTTAGLTRLRVQNPLSVPGDRLHSSGSNRWKQTQGEWTISPKQMLPSNISFVKTSLLKKVLKSIWKRRIYSKQNAHFFLLPVFSPPPHFFFCDFFLKTFKASCNTRRWKENRGIQTRESRDVQLGNPG